ncbi:MAG: hypothetical protein Q8Q23_02385 [bacterium]|nr:hypothetical protein [bacterium]
MAKNIVVKISKLEKNKKGNGVVLTGHGKVIIITNARDILSQPPHWEVEVTITKELDRSSLGEITSIKKSLSKEEKGMAVMKQLVAPLRNKFGDLPLPLWDGHSQQDCHKYGGIFCSSSKDAILGPALKNGDDFYAPEFFVSENEYEKQPNLDSQIAEKIWQLQVAVEPERARLFDQAAVAWTAAKEQIYSLPKIRGREYIHFRAYSQNKWQEYYFDFWTEVPPPRRTHPALLTRRPKGMCIEEFPEKEFFQIGHAYKNALPWTEEGLSSYKKFLENLVVEKEEECRQKAEKYWQEFILAKVKAGWIACEGGVSEIWTSYHDGHGFHSEDDVSGSGVTVTTKKVLVHPDYVGKKPFIGKDAILLTDEEYEELQKNCN